MTATRARVCLWTSPWRIFVFALATTSLGCLLAQFYGVCSMRFFALAIFLPAILVLLCLTVTDFARGDERLGRAVITGAAGGLLAAIAYDLFRLPFVFAREWGIAAVVPAMNLFKVFPAFGAMLLDQPVQQAVYPLGVSVLGWAYHFSNGATIGMMYLALVGDARRRHWAWAVLVACGLELGMICTPYPRVFGIAVTPRFVLVTLAAHAVFGVCLGLSTRILARQE